MIERALAHHARVGPEVSSPLAKFPPRTSSPSGDSRDRTAMQLMPHRTDVPNTVRPCAPRGASSPLLQSPSFTRTPDRSAHTPRKKSIQPHAPCAPRGNSSPLLPRPRFTQRRIAAHIRRVRGIKTPCTLCSPWRSFSSLATSKLHANAGSQRTYAAQKASKPRAPRVPRGDLSPLLQSAHDVSARNLSQT